MKDIYRFEEVGLADVAAVGGKNASLGEMIRALAAIVAKAEAKARAA